LITPPTPKELIEISKNNMLLDESCSFLKKKEIIKWNESVQESFLQIYDQLSTLAM
jgi:hypothetical protein